MTQASPQAPISSKKYLPVNWRWVRLEQVSTPVRGVTFPSGEAAAEAFSGSIACLTTSGVQDQTTWESRRFIPQSRLASSDQMLHVGDLLVSTANSKALVGKSCIIRDVPFPCTFGAFVTVLRPKNGITPEFLAAWMRSPDALAYFYETSSNTTNISNLRVSDLLALELPLPPLIEQKRIAAILTKQLAVVEKARAALEVQVETGRVLVAAELRAIFDCPQALSWPYKIIDEIASTCSGTTPSRTRPDYYGGDIPWIKTAELRDSTIFEAEEHVTPLALEETSLKLLPAGTLLVAMYGQGQTRGRTGLLAKPATINQACFAILPKPDQFAMEFVQWWFRHNYARLRRETEGRGGGQPNLNGEVLRQQKMPLPSLKEQNRISLRLKERAAIAAKIKAGLTEQMEAMKILPLPLLTRAFRGEI